ncbi:MAG: tetratricopeptide repeat protein [Halobacteriovoraceae bacterium]|nr:tetratricopeptide repeat protein [Halobacteriovoraceae bacterium]
MKKYRVRQRDHKISGPFDQVKLVEYLLKDLLFKTDEIAEFPTFEWEKIENNKSFNEILNDIESGKLKLDNLHKFAEKTLASSYKAFRPDNTEAQNIALADQEYPDASEIRQNVKDKKYKDKNDQLSGNTSQHIRVISEKEEENTNKFEKSEHTEVQISKEMEEVDIDATVVFGHNEVVNYIEKDVSKVEEKLKQIDTERIEKIEALKKEQEEIKQKNEKRKIKVKKMSPIVALAFFTIIFVLFEDEKEIKLPPIKYPSIINIEPTEQANAPLGKHFYDEGLKYYRKKDYQSKLLAAENFRLATNNYLKGEAIDYLIAIYAELLEFSKQPEKDARIIYNLIKSQKLKKYNNYHVAYGRASLYCFFKKFYSCKKYAEEYISLNNNQASPELLALLLEANFETGNFKDSDDIFNKLESIKNIKNFMVIERMHNYLSSTKTEEEVFSFLQSREKDFQASAPFYLLLSNYFLDGSPKSLEKLKKIGLKINLLFAEGCPKYLADFKSLQATILISFANYYFEKKDYKSAVINYKNAQKNFEEAHKLFPSSNLRGKILHLDNLLAQIGEEISPELSYEQIRQKYSFKLAQENKVINAIIKAKKAMKDRNWEFAFSKAIEATEYGPNDIEAIITLIDIQIKRGFFQYAIDKLTELRKKFPLDPRVNYRYINTLFHIGKLEKGYRDLLHLGSTEFSKNYRFSLLIAEYNGIRGFFSEAIKNFKTAIDLNPIESDLYYKLANFLFTYGRYKLAKIYINDALSFDPENYDYHILYAKIVAEEGETNKAIGYLESLLKNDGNNPYYLAQIAQFYYRVGKNFEYENVRKKLEQISTSIESFYEFLIKQAVLNNDSKNLLKYSNELLYINPGNLDIHIKLGEYYYLNENYEEALKSYDKVFKRLNDYPKINYLLAKTYLKLNNIEEASKHAQLEIQYNPNIENGHYILGEIYYIKENYKEARKSFEKSISLNSKYVEGLLALGRMKFKQNKFEEAQQLFYRVVKIDKTNAAAHKNLGYLYLKLGQSDMAINSFESYLNLETNSQEVQQIKSLINTLKK